MSRRPMYLKMAAAGITCTLGGPLLMYAVTPTPGELFSRFSPELQASNLANRARRQRDYEDFAGKMREYSKSDKPIWVVAEEEARRAREEYMERQRREGWERERREREEGVRRRGKVRAEAERGS